MAWSLEGGGLLCGLHLGRSADAGKQFLGVGGRGLADGMAHTQRPGGAEELGRLGKPTGRQTVVVGGRPACEDARRELGLRAFGPDKQTSARVRSCSEQGHSSQKMENSAFLPASLPGAESLGD